MLIFWIGVLQKALNLKNEQIIFKILAAIESGRNVADFGGLHCLFFGR